MAPALITLVVTVVRLVGELQGWNPRLFGSEPGGGMAVVGITWLVLVFGFLFGRRLQRAGGGASLGKATALYLIAIAVMAGGGFGLYQAGLISFPSEEHPGELQGGTYLLSLVAAGAVIALLAWGRLTMTLIVYGFLARIPVLIITYLDISRGWDTHYGALPPGAVANGDTELFWALATPQLTLWPLVFTPIAGGLMGCLGAKLAKGA